MSRSEDRHTAERWLATAEDDLRAAKTLTAAGLYAHACFAAQQFLHPHPLPQRFAGSDAGSELLPARCGTGHRLGDRFVDGEPAVV